MTADTLVIGAGPAGLAAAACLGRAGADPVVIDRADAIGASWRSHYERLHLHTPRMQSRLPGSRIPRRCGRWVARDDVVEYLERYARQKDIRVRCGIEARTIERDDGLWKVTTHVGDVNVHRVVVATGYNHAPWTPTWPGRARWRGDLLHASDYRTPRPYVGRDVLVVGTGNTGAEIATDLAEHHADRVRLVVRTPPQLVPRSVLGVPTTLAGRALERLPTRIGDAVARLLQRMYIGDLSTHGLPRPETGLVTQHRASDVIPVIDVGLIRQLRAGRVEPVAAVERFDERAVHLADGTRITPDVVIAATGYRRHLEELVGHLGVLDADGRPWCHGGHTVAGVPNLHFVGMSNPLTGLLHRINADARHLGRTVKWQRESATRHHPHSSSL
jgi:cation diffusion facilitator CzcD-associated flavoprotein CzcO